MKTRELIDFLSTCEPEAEVLVFLPYEDDDDDGTFFNLELVAPSAEGSDAVVIRLDAEPLEES